MSIHSAFGLTFEARFPLPELHHVPSSAQPDVILDLESERSILERFGPSAGGSRRHVRLQDGCIYAAQRGADGSILIEYGDRASFLLSADTTRLSCAPRDPDAIPWRRFLLDTALSTAALSKGFEALHAAAWVGARGVVALVADQGGGKSTLLAEAVRHGRTLFCDDVLALTYQGSSVIGLPGPPLMNLTPFLPDGAAASSVGRVLAELDGECWTAVDRPHVDAAPVEAVFFLRRAGRAAPVESVPASGASLLAHSLVSGPDPQRLASRFALFGDLAQQSTAFQITVPSDYPPGDILALIDASLDER